VSVDGMVLSTEAAISKPIRTGPLIGG